MTNNLTRKDLEEMKALYQWLDNGGLVINGSLSAESYQKLQKLDKCREHLGRCLDEIACLWARHGNGITECASKHGPRHRLSCSPDGTVTCINDGCEQKWNPAD